MFRVHEDQGLLNSMPKLATGLFIFEARVGDLKLVALHSSAGLHFACTSATHSKALTSLTAHPNWSTWSYKHELNKTIQDSFFQCTDAGCIALGRYLLGTTLLSLRYKLMLYPDTA